MTFLTLNRLFKGRLGFVRVGNCWDWAGASKAPTRDVWERARGVIPDGVNVCHTCDRRKCGRPAHRWLGTQSENIQDASRKRRHPWNRSTVQRGFALRRWSRTSAHVEMSDRLRAEWADPEKRSRRVRSILSSSRAQASARALGLYWKGRKRSAETRRKMSKPKSAAYRLHITEARRRRIA